MEAVIPLEISVKTERVMNFETSKNEERLRENLNLLEEWREITYIREALYKQKFEKYYNNRVRPSIFKLGDYVLRLNSVSKAEYQGKLGPTWEGPYVISKAYGKRAYKLAIFFGEAVDMTWNGTNLHKFTCKTCSFKTICLLSIHVSHYSHFWKEALIVGILVFISSIDVILHTQLII